MSNHATANVEFVFSSRSEARSVYEALKPEEELPENSRCTARIELREKALRLEIDAKDTAALRAAVNSFLRLVIVARDMTELGRET